MICLIWKKKSLQTSKKHNNSSIYDELNKNVMWKKLSNIKLVIIEMEPDDANEY